MEDTLELELEPEVTTTSIDPSSLSTNVGYGHPDYPDALTVSCFAVVPCKLLDGDDLGSILPLYSATCSHVSASIT